MLFVSSEYLDIKALLDIKEMIIFSGTRILQAHAMINVVLLLLFFPCQNIILLLLVVKEMATEKKRKLKIGF